MKKLFSSILFLIFISCQNNTSKVNVYDSQENKVETQDSLKLDTITSQVIKSVELKATKNETIEEFLQRMKKISLSNNDEKLEELINFPLIVRGLDENLKIFEDKFYTFNEVKDNIMLYEGLLKEGLKSAISISKGNCTFFEENKNCFSIYMDVWKTTFDFVLKKQNGKYKIVAVQIPTA
ncbi:hypothetical protein [Capnocytophaga sp. oral taxon 864]|uniref:hypothetical protein n=1 Tax=Capnocytophaga sp. oral taxon 864 TaxID=1316593 RepID=UPI000D029EE0|nr:hypothetical protein [Capnocytophaga sp. oral taxon 864]AVM56340.1 hypothetical protein C3V44_11930 [Capnocytophaga sp. oral taxon 864]